MKNLRYPLLIALAFITFLNLSSCNPEDDTIDPVILLKGDNPINIDSIGGSFTEPGFTAVDENDGDISGSVTVAYPVIASDSTRSYKVFYTVKDEAGNSFTTYRTINLRNTVAFMEGIYNSDTLTCANDSARVFQTFITASQNINGDFAIVNFANKGLQAIVTGRLDVSGNLTFQTPVSLLDSDSTIISSIPSATIISRSESATRIEITYLFTNDTILSPTQCSFIMAR